IEDTNSILCLYRRAIRVRRAIPALADGDIQVVTDTPPDCFVFVRNTSGSRATIALNFNEEPSMVSVESGTIAISSDSGREPGKLISGPLRLSGNEAIVIEH